MENRLNSIYHKNPLGFLLLYYILATGLVCIAVGAAGLYDGLHINDILFLIAGTLLLGMYQYETIDEK